MILLLLASVTGLVVLGVAHLVLAARGVPAILRIVRTRARPIRDLVEGDVEVSGTIRAVGDVVIAPSGRRCVVVDVAIDATRGGGRKRERVYGEHMKREARAVVVDASGATAELDFTNVEVVARARITRGHPLTLDLAAKGYGDAAGKGADDVLLIEHAIEDGAQVCVSGVARIVGATVETTEAGYRDGVPVEKRSFVIAGAETRRMLLSEGSEAALLWHATWPVVVLGASSTAALLFAALVIQLMRA